MEDYKILQTDALLDMLAERTLDYQKMRGDGTSEQELTVCLVDITLLQSEIATRISTKLTRKLPNYNRGS